MCDFGPKKTYTCTCTRRTKVRSVRINFRPMQFHLKSTSSNSGHAKPAQTRLPHSNRAKQNRPCTIKFKSNKPKQNQIKMVRSTSFRPPRQAGSKQFNAVHIRRSHFNSRRFIRNHAKIVLIEVFRQCSGRGIWNICNVRLTKCTRSAMVAHKKVWTYTRHRPFWPTQMHTCTRSASEADRGVRHAHDIG